MRQPVPVLSRMSVRGLCQWSRSPTVMLCHMLVHRTCRTHLACLAFSARLSQQITQQGKHCPCSASISCAEAKWKLASILSLLEMHKIIKMGQNTRWTRSDLAAHNMATASLPSNICPSYPQRPIFWMQQQSHLPASIRSIVSMGGNAEPASSLCSI